MDQQQPNKVQQISIEQSIQNIDNNFEIIRRSIIDKFPQIPPKSTVFIFLGKFENKFDTLYNHFEIKQVLIQSQYFKLVKIEEKGKISYLLHFPLILLYDNENDEIAQNLCISKINAELALKKMKQCDFNVILDSQQLTGDDDNAKLKNIVSDSIFQFGTQYFVEDHFFLLRYIQEDKWDCSQLSKENGWLSLFSKKSDKLQVSTHSQHEILQVIFKSDKKLELKTVQSNDYINYGNMMKYLQKKYELFNQLLNNDLKNFQRILLHIQQMPIINSQTTNVAQVVQDYLNELQKELNNQETTFFKISEVYTLINRVNQGENAKKIDGRLSNNLDTRMKQFIQSNKIEKFRIQSLLSEDLLEKLKRIIQFFCNYHNSKLKDGNMFEVQQLKLILKQWCKNSDPALENTLYELKQITSRIQEEPKNEIENGIYFIGTTKVGKSTIINSLLNPENIIQDYYLSQNRYGVKQKTQFTIGRSQVSETQNINGVYIGKKEELNQIFDQNKKHVFSIEEILDQEQMKNCKIPQNWCIFDCPGFDDNINELMRIAHRISLYNYFKKTKNIIVFFVIDISQESIEQIKKTFDPIIKLLENKDDMVSHFDKWTNIILTKAEEGQRNEYINNWENAFGGHLEGDYSFYKKLFENNDRCIEFKKQAQNISEYICNLAGSMIKMSEQQLKQRQFQPQFKNEFDEKVLQLYKHCISKFNSKLESIIDLLIVSVDRYILESNDSISKKRQKIQKIESIFLTQNGEQMITVITSANSKDILQKLSKWMNNNPNLEQDNQFLQQFIGNLNDILKIQNYSKNTNQIAPFEINIDKLVNKIKTAIIKIEQTISYYYYWEYGGYGVSAIAAMMSGGSSLALFQVRFFLAFARKYLLTDGILWGITLCSGTVSTASFIVAFIDNWKNEHLRKIYNEALIKDNNQQAQR